MEASGLKPASSRQVSHASDHCTITALKKVILTKMVVLVPFKIFHIDLNIAIAVDFQLVKAVLEFFSDYLQSICCRIASRISKNNFPFNINFCLGNK